MATEAQLADRTAAVQKDLSNLSSSMGLKQTITAVVGGAALLAIAAFYWYGYSQVKPLLEPKTLVDAGAGLARQKLPEAQKMAADFAKKQLPGMVQSGSTLLLDQLPTVREQAELALLAGADKLLDDARAPVKASVAEMVRKNKKMLADGATELTKSKEAGDKFLAQVSEVAEKELQADLDKTVGTMAASIEGFGATLANASQENAKRSSLQLMLREMLMLTKRLSAEMTEGVDLKELENMVKPVPGVITPTGQDPKKK